MRKAFAGVACCSRPTSMTIVSTRQLRCSKAPTPSTSTIARASGSRRAGIMPAALVRAGASERWVGGTDRAARTDVGEREEVIPMSRSSS